MKYLWKTNEKIKYVKLYEQFTKLMDQSIRLMSEGMKKDPHVDLKNGQTINNRRRRKMRKKLERMMTAVRSNFIFMNYVIFNSLIISYFIYFVYFFCFYEFYF